MILTNIYQQSRMNVKLFLQDFFGISPSYDISLDDIALAYSSPDPDKWVTSTQFVKIPNT